VKPVRPDGPPLYIAGQADVSVKRAARIGDAWLIVNTSGLSPTRGLIATQDDASYTITAIGRAFLQWMVANGISDAKPF
jgi:alkanesulfonate monooxygenase SsuD/methylene tetrahydromethanopterin reductase-like flavin-dependent oxidoreductase (luciferase family)